MTLAKVIRSACCLMVAATAAVAADTAVPLTRQEALERFREMGPEERLKLVEKAAGGEDAFVTVKRGDVVRTVTERGSLEPAEVSEIICQLKPQAKNSKVASTIKWVIDDGTYVKKGQRLMELDDSEMQNQLQAQQILVDQAEAAKVAAEENLKITKDQDESDVRTAELNLKRAKLDLKKYNGDDDDQKELLELMVKEAERSVQRTKKQAKAKEVTAAADAKSKVTVLKLQVEQKRDIEAEIARCVIRAPREGLLMYHVPEQRRFGGSPQPVLAEGEPVNARQKLFRISDLKKMLVATRVHEALVARVGPGQKATVRVDAFPRRPLAGEVKQVANIPSQDWLSPDVKVYATTIALTDKLEGLKPGMSAEVRIEVGRQVKVLRVPDEATLGNGPVRVCYVKAGKGLEPRRVTVGMTGDSFVEIKEGLKEGDVVLRDPGAAAVLVVRLSDKGPQGSGRKAPEPSPQVMVRSVRPATPGAGGARARVLQYGITFKDYERILELPNVKALVPVRSFPADVRRLERKHTGMVVGTSPMYRDLTGIRVAAGRFLTEDDDTYMKNVAVLGADVAERLFPREDPVGQTVQVGLYYYRVVGVLQEQGRPAGGLTAKEVNSAIFIPLKTCRARFGDSIVVRQAGAITREAVDLTEVLAAVRKPEHLAATVESIRALLERAHPRKDWEVRAPGLK